MSYKTIRGGECKKCGKCCELIKCVNLDKRTHLCKIYDNRPENCRKFPRNQYEINAFGCKGYQIKRVSK